MDIFFDRYIVVVDHIRCVVFVEIEMSMQHMQNLVMKEVFVIIELIVPLIHHCVRQNVDQERRKPVPIFVNCPIVEIELSKQGIMNNAMILIKDHEMVVQRRVL